MNTLKILDVTLRDGGCVNNFNFGQLNMEKILRAQEDSGTDIVELGYIDSKAGSDSNRTQYSSDDIIVKSVLKEKKPEITYVAMIDHGKFNIDSLQDCNEKSIDGIRLAFHKKDLNEVIVEGRKIIEKGYQLYIQPMITLRYTDNELLELIHLVNTNLPDAEALYIVDSFGEMRPNDMSRILNLVDYNLAPDIILGFHSHNNLQMSYSNAISMLQFPTNRDFIIDCSIMGMGKGAGNLNTELLMEHLNAFYGKKYNIAPLLNVMDTVINRIHAKYYWGYSPEYYLSASNQCTPSYASFFYNKHMLSIEQIGELLGMIIPEKKISFDKEYAQNLYIAYNESKEIDDEVTVNELMSVFANKRILLIAPGKSINNSMQKIKEIASSEDVLTICLNLDLDFAEYILTTRKEAYEEAIKNEKKVIVCSNISKGEHENTSILNYKNWITIDDGVHDSSGVIALNLLSWCGVAEVLLAGFDGFSMDVTENYYDSSMGHPMHYEITRKETKFFKNFINMKQHAGMQISFITRSMYI